MTEQRLSCRAAVPDDVPFLLELRASTITAQLVAAGIDLSTKVALDRVMHKFECAQIVLEVDRPVGLIKVHRGDRHWEIVQLQLCPSIQGKGVGTWLVQTVIQHAASAQVSLTLSVLHDNPAKRLYQSLGFAVTGSDDHEYFMELVTRL